MKAAEILDKKSTMQQNHKQRNNKPFWHNRTSNRVECI